MKKGGPTFLRQKEGLRTLFTVIIIILALENDDHLWCDHKPHALHVGLPLLNDIQTPLALNLLGTGGEISLVRALV